jgi:hypothetical protein
MSAVEGRPAALSLRQIFSGWTLARTPSSINVDYSDLSLAMMRDSQHRMARQRAAEATWVLIVASEYLLEAAGARRFKSSGPWLTTANILDSESKISPSSNPLGTSSGS